VAWLTKGGKEDGGDALSHGCSTRTIVDLTARHFGKNRSSKRVKTRKKSKNSESSGNFECTSKRVKVYGCATQLTTPPN
jgi:hypothetical protein